MLVMVTDKDGVFTGRVVTLRTNKETAMFQRGYRSTLGQGLFVKVTRNNMVSA